MNNLKYWAVRYTRKYNETAERAKYDKVAAIGRDGIPVVKLGALVIMFVLNFRYRLYKWCRMYTRASVYNEILQCLNRLRQMK
nr:MAG TPA: hypothetical protein [Caudoviricetes sp.]